MADGQNVILQSHCLKGLERLAEVKFGNDARSYNDNINIAILVICKPAKKGCGFTTIVALQSQLMAVLRCREIFQVLFRVSLISVAYARRVVIIIFSANTGHKIARPQNLESEDFVSVQSSDSDSDLPLSGGIGIVQVEKSFGENIHFQPHLQLQPRSKKNTLKFLQAAMWAR